jgi:hypothetical protein
MSECTHGRPFLNEEHPHYVAMETLAGVFASRMNTPTDATTANVVYGPVPPPLIRDSLVAVRALQKKHGDCRDPVFIQLLLYMGTCLILETTMNASTTDEEQEQSSKSATTTTANNNMRKARTYAELVVLLLSSANDDYTDDTILPALQKWDDYSNGSIVNFFVQRIPCDCLEEKQLECHAIEGICCNKDNDDDDVCCLQTQSTTTTTTTTTTTKNTSSNTSSIKLLDCSACKLAKYCSKECQRADWPRHKEICKMLAKRRRTRTNVK